ncbi:hypothetical protein [Streptomyces sp. B6B3]|uniref:hypothetical protein n=1 Tax=Streptomyces sp. B6B3 TaxID=3153570 RepID=UPI00325F7151
MLHEPLRKALLSVAVTAMVTGSLAACGSESEGASNDASEEPAPAPEEGCRGASPEEAAHQRFPDFNGDGHADLAVPARLSTVDGMERAGAVSVVYGSENGPDTENPQVISRATEGELGELAARGTGFGDDTVARDLDGDGFSDLAVTLFQDRSTTVVLWGSEEGLTSGTELNGGDGLDGGDFDGDGQADLLLGNAYDTGAQDGDGLTVLYGPLDRDGGTARRDSFGGGMNFGADYVPQETIVGDLNGDGRDDLVTSQAFEEMQEHGRFYPGGAEGLSQDYRDLDTYSANGVVADVNGDGCGDLVVRDVTMVSEVSDTQEGEVRVLLGSPSGPKKSGEPITQETVGLEGAEGDEFGAALAAGDVNGDGFADVAVGTPGEEGEAGAVTLLMGGEDGLTGTDAPTFGQGLPDVPGEDEPGDRFGTALWLADMNGDDRPELAVGAPGQRDGQVVAGAVWVLGDPAAGSEELEVTAFGPGDLGAPTEGSDGSTGFSPEGTGFGESFGG